AAFERTIDHGVLPRVARLPDPLVVVMPVVGLLVATAVRRWIGQGAGAGTSDEYLLSFHDPTRRMGARDVLARLLASVATIGTGGPMGMEGPSLYAGAAVGAGLQRRVA